METGGVARGLFSLRAMGLSVLFVGVDDEWCVAGAGMGYSHA